MKHGPITSRQHADLILAYGRAPVKLDRFWQPDSFYDHTKRKERGHA